MTDQNRKQTRKSVLADINYATVVASALAAGTALALSTYIGIAGSLIGTVIAAAVSSISSQLYQGIINKSADKIKDVADVALTQTLNTTPHEPLAPSNPDLDTTTYQTDTESSFAQTHAIEDATSSQETVHPLQGTTDIHLNANQTPIASAQLIKTAREHESHAIRRRMFIIAIVAALLALAITAATILAATAGQGIGTKPSFTADTYTADSADTADETVQVEETAEDAADDTQVTESEVSTTQSDTANNSQETDPVDSSTLPESTANTEGDTAPHDETEPDESNDSPDTEQISESGDGV